VALAVALLGAGATSLVACAHADGERAASPQNAEKPEVAAARVDAPVAARTRTARDPRLQAIAEQETEKLVADWKPSLATVVVLAPSTGSVLAMTGRAGGERAEVATTRALEAASTIKPIVVAAALDEGAITPTQRFSCDHGARAYGAKVLHDVGAYDTLDVTQILAVSSNVGASRIFDTIGPVKLQRRLTAFHLGERLGLGVPNEPTGDISRLASGDAWGSMLVAIGHGMTATPVQMAAAYAALANGGTYHRPTLTGDSNAGERVVREETARTVLTMMEQVVEGENGTGKRAHVDGVRVAGKTGTAEYPDASGKTVHYASFIGAVPSERPRYVILVSAEVPDRDDASGGSVAAPVFARIAGQALSR
jgi:cell division protein FtsI (penicillin-binding protein 3)